MMKPKQPQDQAEVASLSKLSVGGFITRVSDMWTAKVAEARSTVHVRSSRIIVIVLVERNPGHFHNSASLAARKSYVPYRS